MCDCIGNINKMLEANDQELPIGFRIGGGKMDLQLSIPLMRKDTGKAETRRSVPHFIVPSYCPFCGAQYDGEPA